jgi:DDE superfamily endonuclease
MQKNNNNPFIAQFQNFRQKLYNCFESCSDACMDLLDALAGNTGADSIAELSLSPLFPRSYNSIYKAIKESFNTTIQETNNEVEVEVEEEKPNNLIRVVSELIDQPQQRPFYLFVTDTTPHPRPYSKTLAERGHIYQPNTIKGNKPINVGHCYSLLSVLPEKETDGHAAWAVPRSVERVSLTQSGTDVASEQIQSVMSDSSLPWHKKLCVLVGDTAYSQRSFLFEQSKHKNLVAIAQAPPRAIARVRSIGKPGHSPKPRGNSTGRVTGHTQAKRSNHPVVKKQSKSTPNKQKSAEIFSGFRGLTLFYSV